MAKAKAQSYTTRIDGRQKFDLKTIDPSFTSNLSKAGGEKVLQPLSDELTRLQELLYAAGTHSLLIVLQGMDTAGKDGTIRHVGGCFDPQGCRVESFKVPTPDELAHDFLWRVHKVTPPRGQVTIFNRSHYEDVIAVRVLKLLPEAVWRKRYERINQFEKLLTENNTIVVKYFLHISADEQQKRLLAREAETGKAWKLAVGDWENRKLWDEYQTAYQDAINNCSTEYAPWQVVSANKKWFRNLAVAHSLVETLRGYEAGWNEVLSAQSKANLQELQGYRKGQNSKTKGT
jgi:PPK2 family polyphosphate:nucleotide phosphotransferase